MAANEALEDSEVNSAGWDAFMRKEFEILDEKGWNSKKNEEISTDKMSAASKTKISVAERWTLFIKSHGRVGEIKVSPNISNTFGYCLVPWWRE